MRSIGIKALKDRLSEYVRLAASGETVLVTDRDRVVAELVPPSSGRATLATDALLAEAVRQGWVTPPTLRAGGPLPTRTPLSPLASVLRDITEDRDQR